MLITTIFVVYRYQEQEAEDVCKKLENLNAAPKPSCAPVEPEVKAPDIANTSSTTLESDSTKTALGK